MIDNSQLTNAIKSLEIFSGKFNCGISWSSSNKKIGISKSIALTSLRDVLKVPNCSFINLQYGDVTGDLLAAENQLAVKIESVKDIDIFSDIDALLSIIKACDVVVTTSNVTAHLAGAVGKKTLLLLPFSKGRIWYWHNERVSTWYPSVNQFFQNEDLSWDLAVKEIAQELSNEIIRKN